MKNLLLGFDVLGTPERMGRSVWDEQEKQKFLLRPEVKFPISVDRSICPSVFQPGAQSSGSVADEKHINILGLWDDAAKMLQWVEQRPKIKALIRFPVAIQLISSPNSSDPMWDTIAGQGTEPAAPSREWNRLGYDVADRGPTSGLSNCSYTADEMTQARRRWGNRVNPSGLLESLEDARAFASFSDARVPDHKPFLVYEIFRIS